MLINPTYVHYGARMKRLFALFAIALIGCGGTPTTTKDTPKTVNPPIADPLVVACEGGAAKSCLKAASDADARGDSQAAANLFTKACELNDALGCLFGGGVMLEAGLDANKGIDLLKKACSQGEHAGCFGAGLAYEGFYGGEPDVDAALEVHQQACGQNFRPCCERVGVIMLQKDPAAGQVLLNKNCEAGEGSSCFELASYMLANDKPAGTTKVLEKGCELQDGESCAEWGLSLSTGRDAKTDKAAALAAFAKGCNAMPPSLRACALAVWADVGEGKTTPKDAANELASLCESGEAMGCFYSGMLAKQAGEDVKPWVTKSCEANADLCDWFTKELSTK